MAMPTNAQLAAQIEAIMQEIADLKVRVKAQEEKAEENNHMLQAIRRELTIMHNVLQWILGLVTTLGAGALIAYLGHIFANWH